MSLTRRDRPSIVIGWAIVVAIAFAIASAAVGTTLGTTLYSVPVALSFTLAIIHAAAIPLAIPRPGIAAVLTVGSVTLLSIAENGGAGRAPWPWAVSTLITHAIVLVLLGVQARTRVGFSAWGLAVASTFVVAFFFPLDTDEAAINMIIGTSVSAFALALGVVFREWRSIRSQLVRERAVSAEEHERRVVAEEKTRIARELHDVVAHSMSLINVQAASAVYRHQGVSEPVAREFDEIASAARGAISELRGVLGVLRDDGMPRELAPQPGLGDIPALIDTTQRTGVDVTLEWTGERDGASGAAGLAAYRIVQEAMSNAIRHAPGSSIAVRCVNDGSTLTVSVLNSASGLITVADDAGHGLIGMRERAAVAGGTVDVGPTPDGGYSVVAHIPLHRERP